jgi:voltage-gated potassium channel
MWVLTPANLIDLMSTLPFYISTLSSLATVRFLFLVRIMRTLRLLRVLASINFAKEIKVYLKSFKNKSAEIMVGLVLVAMSSILLATALYYAEQTASQFDPIIGTPG